jgi:Guanine nucleotide exchange factor synembryn
MEFATRLRTVLGGDDEKESTSSMQVSLLRWNEEIELFLMSGASSSLSTSETQETKIEEVKEAIQEIASKLHASIVTAIHTNSDANEANATAISEQRAEEATRSATTHCQRDRSDIADMEKLSSAVRTVKNLLRWYIQVFSETEGVVYPSPVRRLQSHPMLELYVLLLERYCANIHSDVHNELGRTLSLVLFYATYSPFVGDQHMQESLRHLVETLRFLELVLRILIRPCSAALALSLVRNVHNILVSFQGGARAVATTTIDWESSFTTEGQIAPWAMNTEPTGAVGVTFKSLLPDLAIWALRSDPPFPGDDEEDKRYELVTEILSSFYALRVGSELRQIPKNGDSTKIAKLVLELLHISSSKSDFQKSDKRAYRCQLLVVSLLMDAHPSFVDYLASNDAVPPLLEILEIQVTTAVEETRVDQSTTAELVPILVVLHKVAMGSETARRSVKNRIFPPEAETHFLDKIQQQKGAASGQRNMGPLDAPRGTLRWKMCRLMTWTEAHVKRCTNELMWIICSSDATEFVYRTGLGNAMPMLNLKGYVDIPGQSLS